MVAVQLLSSSLAPRWRCLGDASTTLSGQQCRTSRQGRRTQALCNASFDALCVHDSCTISGVAQWLACWAHNPKVRGSKPRSAMCAVGKCARAETDPLPLVKCGSCSPFTLRGRPHIGEIRYRKDKTKTCVAKRAPRTLFPLFHSPLLAPAIMKIILSFKLPLMQSFMTCPGC